MLCASSLDQRTVPELLSRPAIMSCRSKLMAFTYRSLSPCANPHRKELLQCHTHRVCRFCICQVQPNLPLEDRRSGECHALRLAQGSICQPRALKCPEAAKGKHERAGEGCSQQANFCLLGYESCRVQTARRVRRWPSCTLSSCSASTSSSLADCTTVPRLCPRLPIRGLASSLHTGEDRL